MFAEISVKCTGSSVFLSFFFCQLQSTNIFCCRVVPLVYKVALVHILLWSDGIWTLWDRNSYHEWCQIAYIKEIISILHHHNDTNMQPIYHAIVMY